MCTGRTNFEQMVRHLKTHANVRTVLVEKTDRLYRNLRDWVTLDELDIEIHLVKEGVVLSRDPNPRRGLSTASRC
jgi:site-specific DNA recombinase